MPNNNQTSLFNYVSKAKINRDQFLMVDQLQLKLLVIIIFGISNLFRTQAHVTQYVHFSTLLCHNLLYTLEL